MDRQKEELLRNILRTHAYQYTQETYQDIASMISRYPTLKSISSDLYTTNAGVTRSLLKISGTIPIEFQNARYNIPVTFWVQEQHPAIAPMCYVVPTSTMVVKTGPHVNADGLIFLPYLSQWSFHSNMTALVDRLKDIFSREPPVYARPPGRPQSLAPTASVGGLGAGLGQSSGDAKSRVYEQLSRRLREMENKMRLEMEDSLADAGQLSDSGRRIDDLLRQIREDEAATEQAMQSHRSAIERMAAELSKSHDETIDPDNLVSAQSPLHTQLVGCVAEHAAIEDTLFYLSKALAKKLIPLQDYLTNVRELSRREFTTRALIMKARAAAGLPPAL